MDNFESIFQNVRQQLENELLQSNRRNQSSNENTQQNTPFIDNVTSLVSDYMGVIRLNQELMSIFNLNMLTIIELLRTEQNRVERERRSREDAMREHEIRANIFEPRYTRFRAPGSNIRANNNRPFQSQLNQTYRAPTLFGISDISRNLRSNIPTVITSNFIGNLTPRNRNNQLDARHFFGGLGPELRDVVIRPTNSEIERATRTYTFTRDMVPFNHRCYITMEDFEEGDQLREIYHCRHTFKNDALLNWFQEHVRCPVCRFDIREYQPGANEMEEGLLGSRNSSRNSLNSSSESIGAISSGPSSPLNQENNTTENFTNTDDLGSTSFITESLAQDVSNGINDILENLVNDISNNGLNTPANLRYSLSVPIIYHEFFDSSNNLSFNNLQFNSSP